MREHEFVLKLSLTGFWPRTIQPHEYLFVRPFDRALFVSEYTRLFTGIPKYSPASIPDLLQLLDFMEQDSMILDLRWMAYMLGTAFVETSKVKSFPVPGRTKPMRRWINFQPLEETAHGKGFAYHLPVKVKQLADGSARIIEQDGDTFIVDPSGRPKRSPGRLLGVRTTTTSQSYAVADGTALAYYGAVTCSSPGGATMRWSEGCSGAA